MGHIKDTLYFKAKEQRVASARLGRAFDKAFRPFFESILNYLEAHRWARIAFEIFIILFFMLLIFQ